MTTHRPTHISQSPTPVVIIGAGPTGLGAANELERLGCGDWVLLEREAYPGGLSASFIDEKGFTWDVGGHVVFSHYESFDRALDEALGPDGWIEHERESWIRLLGRWIPYPLQNNLGRLPREEMAQCLAGLVRAAVHRPSGRPANFDEALAWTFGEPLADLFFRPDNRKRWGYDPKQMCASWTGDRISVPDPERLVKNAVLGVDDVSWGPNRKFRFPRCGGTGAIWKAMADRPPPERVIYGAAVIEVDTRSREVALADGRRFPYGALISTAPLDELARRCGVPDWIEGTRRLKHSAIHVVGLGLSGRPPESLRGKCWMYFPGDEVPFFRVTHFSHYSPANVPSPETQWSLMAEIAETPHRPVQADSVVQRTTDGLIREGLITSDQALHRWTRRFEYGYPTPSLERDEIVNKILPAMERESILSRGRFGAWLYEVGNMDHSYMQGVEAARRLVLGAPEWTLWRPHVVNTAHPAMGWGLNR